MDNDKRVLTENIRKFHTTGIRAVDDVHNFVYDLRLKGKPCLSLKLRPAHFSMYAFWVSKMTGVDKVYAKDGSVSAPITVDGIGIERGSENQFAYILPHYLPMDNKTADKYRRFNEDKGAMPEHHSQIN